MAKTLELSFLEDRCTPASVFAEDGQVTSTTEITYDGFPSRSSETFTPFTDFLADHYTSSSGDAVAVGAAPGGGPRVQLRVAGAVVADFFAYEPSFRSGVHVGISRELLVTGAGNGGGPIVAVYDLDGNERARFFAYDPEFRGGVRVAITGDRLFTAPGPGGGPHIREWTAEGVLVDEWMVGDVDRRSGFEPLLGDFDHDQVVDVGVWDGRTFEFNGHVSIIQPTIAGFATDATIRIGSGMTWSEAGGVQVAYAGTYFTHGSTWMGLRNLIPVFSEDLAAGNPSPPITTGIRPGNRDPADNAISGHYRDYARTVDLAGSPATESISTLLGEFTPGDRTVRPVATGASVGSLLGTGTSLGTFEDADGNAFLVTARHVLYASPFAGDPFPLIQPGRADGGGSIVTEPPYLSPAVPIPPATYMVDAVAVPIGESDAELELFRGRGEIERPAVVGRADEPARGDLLIAVGRGGLVGVGYLIGRQQVPIPVNWGNLAASPLIADQWLAVGLGVGDLSYPGFSGGPVYRVTREAGLELVGMTVAGGGGISLITPLATIEQALSLTAIIR